MNEDSSSSHFLRKRTPGQTGQTAEERVFGPKFRSKLLKIQNQPVNFFGVLVSACAIVVSAIVMFLLGVNIVIQYRTIVPEDRSGMVRKACYIVLSAATVYLLNKFNLWFLRKVISYFASGTYNRLPTQDSFEMSTRA